jgi:hypothetical protein
MNWNNPAQGAHPVLGVAAFALLGLLIGLMLTKRRRLAYGLIVGYLFLGAIIITVGTLIE